MKVGLVACCSEKRRSRSEAQHLYCSPLFVLSAKAAAGMDAWAILSAKHGVLLPREEAEPYDQTLNGMSAAERKEWARKAGAQLREKFPGASFVVFAGERYAAALKGLDWTDALAGLPIGKRLKALKEGTWTT